MALDWENPKPSNPEYLKDILLGYMERCIAAAYYKNPSSSFNPSNVVLPFTATEFNTLAKTLLLDSCEGRGSHVALVASANIILKYLVQASGLTDYWDTYSVENCPAQWTWNGSSWECSYTPYDQLSGYLLARSALWITDTLSKGISLDGATAVEVWKSMRRALDAAVYLPVYKGYDGSFGTVITESDNYSIADVKHVPSMYWDVEVEWDSNTWDDFANCLEAWAYEVAYRSYVDSETDRRAWGNGSSWGINPGAPELQDGLWYRGSYGIFGQLSLATLNHSVYTWQEPIFDEEWNIIGWEDYSEDMGTGYGAEGYLYEISFSANYEYTPSESALVEVPEPGEYALLIPPAVPHTMQDTSWLTDPNTNPASLTVEGSGDWENYIRPDKWSLAPLLGDITFNEEKSLEHFGDFEDFSQLPDPDEPENPSGGGFATAAKGWQWAVPQTYDRTPFVLLVKPAFVH